MIETVNTVLASIDKDKISANNTSFLAEMSQSLLPNIFEDSELRSSVSALDLDPALRAKMLQRHSSGSNVQKSVTYETPIVICNGKIIFICFRKYFHSRPALFFNLELFSVNFEVPVFTVELKADFGNGERGLVELSFRDFILQYERCSQQEVVIQVDIFKI